MIKTTTVRVKNIEIEKIRIVIVITIIEILRVNIQNWSNVKNKVQIKVIHNKLIL